MIQAKTHVFHGRKSAIQWRFCVALAFCQGLVFGSGCSPSDPALPAGKPSAKGAEESKANGGSADDEKPEDGKADDGKTNGSKDESAKEAAPAPDSPRAALSRYLELCRKAKYAEAARYLELPADDRERGPELARRLRAVLDRYLWIELKTISPLPTGDLADGLLPQWERVGEIPGSSGTEEAVLLIRRPDDPGAPWVFSASTVDEADAAYDNLSQRWLLDHLPKWLQRRGPYELAWWQWSALPLVIGFSALAAIAITRFCVRRFAPLINRHLPHPNNENLLASHLQRPLTWAWLLAIVYLLLHVLGLNPHAQAFADRLLRVGAIAILFWIFASSADLGHQLIGATAWAREHPTARALLPLISRAIKFFVLALIAIGFLSALGYPITSLLTGLGLGGLAFALAAQKTVENVFGAVSIGVDQPFRAGDFVKIEDFVGTVETIGLRSTRFRTLDRTLITIPNGKLADSRVETYSVRDRIRLAFTVGLVYNTSTAQLRTILDQLEQALRTHPKIWPDSVTVRFSALGAASLDIEIMAWFLTSNWDEFQNIRQEILLKFVDIIRDGGSEFAVPTQVLRLSGQQAGRVTPEAIEDDAPNQPAEDSRP